MAELRIYDSQGTPIQEGGGLENQQIKDFFFDGVRFAVDMKNNKMFCFFRARDNDTARSEQYYAEYTYDHRSEMSSIYESVKTRIESDYGMILDTENEDTQFFELLGASTSGRVPNDSGTIDDVSEILSNYQQARLGVSSYDEAYGLFSELFDTAGVQQIAVSDNATGQSLTSYDLVIEQGEYFGLELLGDTEEKVESLRERRRPSFDSEFQTEEETSKLSGAMGAVLFGGIGVVVIVGVLYGSCLGLGITPPGVGSPPFASCGPTFSDVSAEVTGNNSEQLRITGNLSGVSDEAMLNVSVTGDGGDGNVVINNSSARQIGDSGQFNFTVPLVTNGSALPPGDYELTVEHAGQNATATFTIGNETAEQTPPSTPAGEQTPVSTDTQTPEEDPQQSPTESTPGSSGTGLPGDTQPSTPNTESSETNTTESANTTDTASG